MLCNPEIFRAYDVRGRYGVDFDAEMAQRFGMRFAAHHAQGPLVIGRDMRDSSGEIAHAVIDGAMHAGAQVIDIGVVSSPQCYWAIRSQGAAAGVMVTASHNSLADNGFKTIARHGDMLEVIGGDVVRQMFDSHQGAHRMTGSISRTDILRGYADAVAYAAHWRGGSELMLSLDAPDTVRRVLERLGPIAPDTGLAVRCDSDGDRIDFFEHGVQIPADFIFLLLAEQLQLHPVVFDVRFSKTVRNRFDARRIAYTVSRVGRRYIISAMRSAGAIFGGELSGHYYWREFGMMECPELTLLRVYMLIRESGHTLSQLVAPYREYVRSDEISIPMRDHKHARSMMEALRMKYHDGAQSQIDGLSIEYPDWWLNIRPSNTEPVIRIVVEAITKQLLDSKISEVMVTLRR